MNPSLVGAANNLTRVPATSNFPSRLAAFGDRAALVTPDETVTYADLASRVDAMAARIGTGRKLMLITGANEIEPIVAYLAALCAGHPAILVPGDNAGNVAAVAAAYDPDVLFTDAGLEVRRDVSAHDLHPELALLLSTSGSTGTPKLVRLSRENLQANATSIATYLGIRETDVAATTLPMHYCYGLSVINSHLLSGAALMLTSLSVVDDCFWDRFRRHGATSFAGVPYTFDLLDRVGFESMDLPTLRYVTQAGGRLAPAQVQRYAALGRRRGWDLFVMYGQTEATARMAYLPPDLAAAHPSAIGVPIPGGTFSLEPVPSVAPGAGEPGTVGPGTGQPGTVAPGTGELVYRGDNVMLGYATTPADLALGRTITELRTGDLARRTSEGLYEVVGRTSRFAKIFGLRIDLDQTERVFAGAGLPVFCADAGDTLVVATEASPGTRTRARILTVAKQQLGLPAAALDVRFVDEVPRLATGKPDYAAIAHHNPRVNPPQPAARRTTTRGSAGAGARAGSTGTGAGARAEGLRGLYGELLNRADVTDDDSFVTLEGDSLSYVEMSIRLEDALGHLPANWHVTPIGELAATARDAAAPGRRRRWRSVETNVLLRALAILLIVGSHGNLFLVVGGAHLLLGVAGFNFGRFHLTSSARPERLRHLATSLVRIVVPSVLWIGTVAAFSSEYSLTQAALLNGVLGPESWTEPQWYYWFIEALVYTLVALTLLLAVPWVDRLERRWSFWFPVSLAALGLLTRYEVVTLSGGDVIHRAHIIFWLFALGWATAKASAHWQRALLAAVIVGTVPGFFDDPQREALVAAGLLALVWVPALPVPSWVSRGAGVLAAASLYIYLAHWQIYPHFEDRLPLVAVLLSLVGGIAFWQAATRAPTYLRRNRKRPGRAVPPATCTVLAGVACICAGPGPRCSEK